MDATLFLADLEAKPASLRRLADTLAQGNPWREQVTLKPPVVLLGMGSSRYAASTIARRLRARGLQATAEYASTDPLPPSAITTGAMMSVQPHLTTVGISASGATAETVDALGRCVGSPAIALTNHVDSPIARAADVVFPLLAGEEAGGVACRTFQHTLALLLMLDAIATGRWADARALATIRRAAEATEDLLERRDAWLPEAAGILGEGPATFAIAPAERSCSAEQSALMFREGPRRTADSCESGDWLHVDVYLTKPLDYRALLFAGSRFDAQIMDWVRQRGSRVVAVGAEVPGAVAAVRYVHDDDADVALLTEVVVAELIAATWWNEGRTW
jgi:glucosamine--fructose-6-phosphate aminotransferase (isomerizing)